MSEWVEPIYIIGAIGVWCVLPFQLWAMWRSIRQYRRWERHENACFERWKVEMDKLAREQAEVDQMRAELTIELDRARKQTGNGPVTPSPLK